MAPKELNPEEITFLDPACGSGHILVETYNVLKAIYQERGYRTKDIPRLILEKNLYGLDIDDRAAQLACFAVLMRAGGDDRRVLSLNNVKLNVMSIKESKESDNRNVELFFKGEYETIKELLKEIIKIFKQAKTFGSLTTIPEDIARKIDDIETMIEDKIGNRFFFGEAQNLAALVRQANVLSRKYDCVVANPPYMGSKGMNFTLKAFAKKYFKNSKSDLFAMFIEHGFDFVKQGRYCSMVTMQSWMFLSSFEKARKLILDKRIIECMVHMANMVMGIAFGTAATIWRKIYLDKYIGNYSYVNYDDLNAQNIPFEFPIKNSRLSKASANDFNKIPWSPIAYWISERIRKIFDTDKIFETFATPRQGLGTTNNDLFTRLWSEVNFNKIAFGCENKDDALASNKKWFSYSKGGGFRKWYGNDVDVVNWGNDGESIRDALIGKNPNIPRSETHYFKAGITWGLITSAKFSARFSPKGGIFDVGGSKAFPPKDLRSYFLGLLNSKLTELFLKTLNPTLNFQVGDLKRIPVKGIELISAKIDVLIKQIIIKTSSDWNSYETSWDFTSHPLLQSQWWWCHQTLVWKKAVRLLLANPAFSPSKHPR
jgi:type II restriction/modification system DNA methylase subunit YeeA